VAVPEAEAVLVLEALEAEVPVVRRMVLVLMVQTVLAEAEAVMVLEVITVAAVAQE
tara:strand:- start:386 stop:553 length:168 start_codon:yes stop_codon:yes gene_type:complete